VVVSEGAHAPGARPLASGLPPGAPSFSIVPVPAPSPQVLIPPHSPIVTAITYAAPTLLLGSLSYGTYRAFRRFPRTTGVLGTLTGTLFGAFVYNIIYSDSMRYGFGVRAALARPRVTSPLGLKR